MSAGANGLNCTNFFSAVEMPTLSYNPWMASFPPTTPIEPVTVVGSANTPRPASVRRQMERKLAAVPGEYAAIRTQWPEFETDEELEAYLVKHDLKIPVWTADDIGATEAFSLKGSPHRRL